MQFEKFVRTFFVPIRFIINSKNNLCIHHTTRKILFFHYSESLKYFKNSCTLKISPEIVFPKELVMNSKYNLNIESAKLRSLRALLAHESRTLLALVPHVLQALRALVPNVVPHVPCALLALVPHMSCALGALMSHVPRTLLALLLMARTWNLR